MPVRSARPDISSLVFRLFDRSVHPELFSTFARQEIVKGKLAVTLRVCDAGHTVHLRWQDSTVTEVVTSREQPLPQTRCRLQKRLVGHRDALLELDCGIRYHSSFQVERLDPEVFMNFHEELSLDCDKASLSHRFSSGSRLAPGPLSLIQTDITTDCLLIHAFHTFPENCAVVKTQSLFEWSETT